MESGPADFVEMGLFSSGGEQFDNVAEDFVAVGAGKGEGELSVEEAVFDAEVVAAPFEFAGEITLLAGEGGEGVAEVDAAAGLEKSGEVAVDGWRQDVHAEEAEIITRAEAGDDEFLLGFGGRGLFQHGFDLIEAAGSIY